MLGLLTWLTGSKVGRYFALGVVTLLTVAFAVLKIMAVGASREAAKHDKAMLRRLKNRMKTDDEISRLEPDDRRERLRDWAR